MIEFKLPALGADMERGTLLEWMVKPGDTVKRGQVVAVVDTTKAAIDVESWQEGTVYRLLVQPDETIPVGTPMALFLAPGESAPSEAAMTPAPPAPVTKVAHAPSKTVPHPRPHAATVTGKKVSPAARKRAEELKVDLETLTQGSGPGRSIVVADVERAAGGAKPPAALATDRPAQMRQTIAAAMSRSKREIPHYYLAETVPLEKATRWLSAQNAQRPMDKRLLMAVLFVKAVAMTLERYPELNGYYRDGEFQARRTVHVGIAIFLRNGGLVAPAIHDVAEKNLEELMAGLSDLIQRARAGSLRSSELSDPTVTVTSLGDEGVELVQPIIYPPQVSIVGFGRVGKRPMADKAGAVVAIPAVTATLAADHRVSDGHRGALFLAALREILQKPQQLA